MEELNNENVVKEKSNLMKVIDELAKGDAIKVAEMYKYVKNCLPKDKEKTNIEKLKLLAKYDDIANEFFGIIGKAKYVSTPNGNRLAPLKITKTEKSVCVNGYTAFDIMEKEPCLLPDTAYIWLVSLRDDDGNISKGILSLIENGIQPNAKIKLTYNISCIKKYFTMKENQTDVVANQLTKKYYDYPDIANEFEYWIRTQKFVEKNPITEQGYTAQKLYDQFHDVLDVPGVFAELITLRTDPEKGLEYIKNNFSTK